MSRHKSDNDEWTSCLGAALDIAGNASSGETFTVTGTVTAEVARNDTDIELELTPNLEIVEAPGAMRRSTSRAAEGVGQAAVASERRNLAAGASHQFAVRVRAVADGPATIRLRAAAAVPGGTDAADDAVFLTVGQRGQPGRPGIDVPAVGQAAPVSGQPVVEAGRHAPLPPDASQRPARDEAAPSTDASAPAGQSCGLVGWFYVDQTGVTRPSRNLVVQFWDHDSFSGNDLLASGFLDGNGRIRLCWANDDGDPFDDSTQEVYVNFVTDNNRWKVQRTGTSNAFRFQLFEGARVNVGDTVEHEFGNWQAADANLHRGLHAYDEINDAWFWLFGVNGPNDCWDGNDTTCLRSIVNWAPDSTDGTYYNGETHLAADDPNSRILVNHEHGHFLMDDVYEGNYPATPNCNPHSVEGVSSTGCAWSEGFAEWFPASVYNDPAFRWPNGASRDLENNSWETGGWGDGDAVEGRVASAMIDTSDVTNEAPWDRYGEGHAVPGNQWTTFLNNRSATYAQFWQQRGAGFFNVASSGALAGLFQSTIDYSFRDPLGNYAELLRPTPEPNHNYSYNTNVNYWSVTAVRPPVGADYDLSLYDDFGQTAFLSSSAAGSNVIDFVAVDSNRRPFGDYYPRINDWTGTGGYVAELAQGSQTVGIGTTTVPMGTNDVVAVRDVFLTAGQTLAYALVPQNAGQDGELFIVASDANAATWVRPRSSAVATGSATGAGGAEGFSYTAATTGWHGLIVTNRAGSGSYSLYLDNTAPTGTIAINAGAAETTTASVTVTNNVTDPNTGVGEMRHSVDGVVDTEPWVPFAATRALTLPGPNGTKTVFGQFRNRAGQVSQLSDTISLQACTITGTAGNDVLNGTAGNDVICGLGGNDTLNGLGGNDILNAGTGNDILVGGPGNDTERGDPGIDTFRQGGAADGADAIFGGPDVDTVDYSARVVPISVSLNNIANDGAAGEGDNVSGAVENVRGGSAADVLVGNTVANLLTGGGGNDTLRGGPANDTLIGGPGNDQELGEDGNDLLRQDAAANGADVLDGGTGVDTADYQFRTTAVSVILDAVANDGAAGEADRVVVENVVGGSAADFLRGSTAANVLTGNAGNDRLDAVDGIAGNDRVDGGLGTDNCTTDSGDIRVSCP